MSPLPCTLIETQSDEAFVEQSVALLTEHITHAITTRGECIVGLSGGSTPGPVYRALGTRTDIDWSKVKLFLIDDRLVPAEHEDSNQHLVRNTLLAHATVPSAQLYFPDTTLSPSDCAVAYSETLIHLFASNPPDIVVLGLGPDGHTASLFPPVPEEAFGEVLALHTTTDAFAVHDRITVSPLVLMASQAQLLLLKGADKRGVLDQAINGELNPVEKPLQIALATGRLTAVLQ